MGFWRNFFNMLSDNDSTKRIEKEEEEDMTEPVDNEHGSEADEVTLPMMPNAQTDDEDQTDAQSPPEKMVDDDDDDFVTLPEVGTVPLNETEDYRPGVTRPLNDEPASNTLTDGHVIYGQTSNTGMVRNNNQDAAMSFYFASDTDDEIPDFGVFIVADGMGGHKEGEKASALTARTILTDLFTTIYLPMIKDEDQDAGRFTITEALVQATQKANQLVRRNVQDGGTTCTVAVIIGYQAYFSHVGDSRAYLISQNGAIDLITRDHSVVQRLIELDQLTPEEAEHHEQRNVLYRAVGQNEEVDVDILRRRLQANTSILICSDGLWGMVDDEEIADIVNSSADPQIACDRLIATANKNGGTDNITALVLKMPAK